MTLPSLTVIPAGAGSGKTYRIQQQLGDWVRDGRIAPERIMAVTFTETAAVPGWQTLENDVASQAMALIRQRLGQVRAGEVRLNRDSDAKFFEKEAGIIPYALQNSPLIGLFTVAGEPQ